MKENDKGKEILKLLQDNYDIKTAQKSKFGEFEFEMPKDRNGGFEPQIVPKNTRDVSGIEDKIILLYGRG